MNLKLPENIYISSANVDMRKSIDGLSSIVISTFNLNQFSDAMFVFHNRHCDKVKILYWDKEGFCLLYKRMERDKFRFTRHIEEDVYTIAAEEMLWLLHGLHFDEMKHYREIVT